MNEIEKFNQEKLENIEKQALKKQLGIDFVQQTADTQYTYNFTWLGRPIIQFPQDMIALQELIWNIKPDLIIETGIAHGGSLIFSASICELLGHGEVLGIDIDIREHNRKELEKHPLYKRISMIEGSSISSKTFAKVQMHTVNKEKILVLLDSNHTHKHVLEELHLYAPLVSKESYIVVYDTSIEDMPEGSFPNRPWDKGNNPRTAVLEYLKENDNFVIDKEIENKLLITVASDGYLKRIK